MTTDSLQSATDPDKGLDDRQVAQRVEQGLTNEDKTRSSRSVADILRANIFTLFNALLGAALVCVLIIGSWPDAVFGFVLIINALTGIISELRAKRTLDNLAILDSPRLMVRRSGQWVELESEKIVQDDIIKLSAGLQIPADGVIVSSSGCEVDESILTGESDSVVKKLGDEVLSGSTVVSGSATVQVTKVGAESYAQKIVGQAKRFSLARSELQAGINSVLRVISWLVIPLTAFLAWAQLRAQGGVDVALSDGSWRSAVVKTIAGLVGMVPQGLVLLTSLNFALAAMMLARRRILIEELPAVEVLARVDTLCLDKTGTLTSGKIEADRIICTDDEHLDGQQYSALVSLIRTDQSNATSEALSAWLDDNAEQLSDETAQSATVDARIPFSSARKWSAVSIGSSSFYLGAPEILLDTDDHAEVLQQVHSCAAQGQRVLAFVQSDEPFSSDESHELPAQRRCLALAVLHESLREQAAETLQWFAEQDVDIKIISGDNPVTVAAIASRLGMDVDPADGIDARDLPDHHDQPELFAQKVTSGKVFGRVSPEQKKAIVTALQKAGHSVAMTGDGVNDALALKKADLGIAMGSGAQATKAAAKVVLMEGNYSTLPMIVAEGRRVIANMERVASLFLNKTVYAAIIAVFIAIVGWNYPFLPRQLTLIGMFTIGIPAFFLSLPPNSQRYRPGFLVRTLWRAIPAGIVAALAVIVVKILGRNDSADILSTKSTMVIVIIALALLATMTRPLKGWRGALLAAMVVIIIAVVTIPFLRQFFMLASLSWAGWLEVGIICLIGAVLVILSARYAASKD